MLADADVIGGHRRSRPTINRQIASHSHEKVGLEWLVTSSKLSRLREDVFNGVVAVYISPRIRQMLMAARKSVLPLTGMVTRGANS